MEKQKEIQLLKSLKEDTYFCQYFSSADIDMMCRNIEDDHPIEIGCTFTKKGISVLKYEHSLAEIQESYKDSNRRMLDSFVEALNEDGFCEDGFSTYNALKDVYGIDAIIKSKRKQDIELSDKEIDYLISKI